MATFNVVFGLFPINPPSQVRRPIPPLPDSCFTDQGDEFEFIPAPTLRAVVGGAHVLGESEEKGGAV